MRPMGRKKGSCSIRRTPQNRAAPLKTRSCGYLSMWRPAEIGRDGRGARHRDEKAASVAARETGLERNQSVINGNISYKLLHPKR